MDLRERIDEELEKNPALDVLEDKTTVSLETAENLLADNLEKEEDSYFENTSDSGLVSKATAAEFEERQNFIEGTLTQPESLQEHLLWQIRLEPLDTEIRRFSEMLVQNLDSDGFHIEPVDVLLSNEEKSKVDMAIRVVQGLDPAGTCTGSYKESLLVQVELLTDAPAGTVEALSHLELLERGKISEVARIMGRTEDEIKKILARIKELSPYPGRSFSRGETRYVVPDIQVIKKDGEFVIILNEEEIPVLGINPFLMKIADKKDREVRDFARENIREARWFINAINQRNHTLLRVARAIVEYQRPFFTNGPKHMAPLTLKDIAGELGIHNATVSRTAHGKYMQTEWGIFEIRHFFSNSITGTGSGGSRFSKEGVKENIKEIIQAESSREKAGHLSDQAISDILAKKGIKIARRTVAKYRNEL